MQKHELFSHTQANCYERVIVAIFIANALLSVSKLDIKVYKVISTHSIIMNIKTLIFRQKTDDWSTIMTAMEMFCRANKYVAKLDVEFIDGFLALLILAGVAMSLILLFVMKNGAQKETEEECKLLAHSLPKWAFSILNLLVTYFFLFKFRDLYVRDKQAVTLWDQWTFWEEKIAQGKFLYTLFYDVWDFGQISQQYMAVSCVVGFIVVMTCLYRTGNVLKNNHTATLEELVKYWVAAILYGIWVVFMYKGIFLAAISEQSMIIFLIAFGLFVYCLLQI